MLEYSGKWENDKQTLERVFNTSVAVTKWAYCAMYHNAERVNKTEITFNEGWKNHLSICQESTPYGLQRGVDSVKQEYLSLIQE